LGNTVNRDVIVLDFDTIDLNLSLSPTSISENGGTSTATVTVTTPLASDLRVSLASNDTTEATVPASIVILAGQSSASFTVTAVDDGDVDGTQTVTITATGSGSASANLDITDDEDAGNSAPQILSLSGPHCGNAGFAGQSIIVSGLFTDADAGDTHSVTIDWGDGDVDTLAASDVDQVADSFAADHTYSDGGIYVATVTVSDGTGQSVAQLDIVITGVGLTDNGTLQIVGTAERDQVDVSRAGNGIRVRAKFDKAKWQTFNFGTNEVFSIDVFLCEGKDKLKVSSDLHVPMVVDGGGGDDHIETGAKDDTIIDLDGNNTIVSNGGDDNITTGSGNDDITSGSGDDVINAGNGGNKVWGGSGDDIVITGNGRDWINGQGGDDVLSAGDDTDILLDSSGDNILIGGGGADRLLRGSGGNILIGGTTDYDDDAIALQTLLDEWSSSNPYLDRIANIRVGAGHLRGIRFEANQTVRDDDARDLLFGSAGADWYFADLDRADRDDDQLVSRRPDEEVDLF
jgi:Ca2+-binding RTX toxin-like protein